MEAAMQASAMQLFSRRLQLIKDGSSLEVSLCHDCTNGQAAAGIDAQHPADSSADHHSGASADHHACSTADDPAVSVADQYAVSDTDHHAAKFTSEDSLLVADISKAMHTEVEAVCSCDVKVSKPHCMSTTSTVLCVSEHYSLLLRSCCISY